MTLERSYLLTLSLLIFHQIDAAYWKEWEMFYLPGGIQVFLVFNIVVIPILLVGYKNLVVRTTAARIYSYLCGGLGILTFLVHLVFLYLEAQQFHLPLSIIIIALCLAFGIWQIVLTRKIHP